MNEEIKDEFGIDWIKFGVGRLAFQKKETASLRLCRKMEGYGFK